MSRVFIFELRSRLANRFVKQLFHLFIATAQATDHAIGP